MAKVSSSIKNEPYKIEIKSPTGNVVVADEPVDKGGKDLGFSPKELLAAALAACTSATVRMYAERKEWALEEVKIDVDLERDDVANKTVIERKIQFIGALNDDQKKRLLAVAIACPVHKILSNPVEITTTTYEG
jgi:putative redox protein